MSLIRGPGDFGLPKVKLSTILNPVDAVETMADVMCRIHQEINQGLPATHRTAMAGNDTEILWNTLLNFYEGGHIALINDKPLIPARKFLPTEELLQALLNSIIDVDIDRADWFHHIPPNHPVWVIQNMLQVYENKRMKLKDPASKAFKEDAIRALTQLLEDVLVEVGRRHPDMQLIHGELVGSNDVGAIVNVGAPDNITFPADTVAYQRNGKLTFDPIAFPSLIGNRTQAKVMHERMVAASRYLDEYQKALTDFATKPNPEADELFRRVQAKRPHIPDGNRPKVSVVGLGPSGAIAAIRAYQEGAIVTGIEQRPGYSRNNTFRFIPELMEDFFKLFVDNPDKDIPALPDTHPLKMAFQISAMGKRGASPAWGKGWHEFTPVTFRDFEYLVNSWVNLMANRDPNGMRLYRGYRYEPGSVLHGAQAIEIVRTSEIPTTTPRAVGPSSSSAPRAAGPSSSSAPPTSARITIPTDILVGGDGYNSQCRQDAGISALKMSSLAHYGTYNYHPPREDERQFFKSMLEPIPRRVVDIPALQALGWQHDLEPVPRFFNTGNHPYIGVEIPPNIVRDYRALTKQSQDLQKVGTEAALKEAQRLKEQRFDIMNAWGLATIKMFVTDEQAADLVLKDCAIIDVQLQKAEKVTATTPTYVTVLLIGDAAQSAHFQTGSGAIMGIRGGFDVGKLVKDIVAGKPQDAAIKAFEKSGRERGVALHEWAFNFPSGEELNVRPNAVFQQYRGATREALLRADPTGQQAQHTSLPSRVTAETSKEAQVKATTIVTRKKR